MNILKLAIFISFIIKVIDNNAVHIASIQATSPRYLKQVNQSKAYVSDWGINGIQVIDLVSNTISSTIDCGVGPEGIAISNGFAYVCNVGGWGLDSTVTVINTSTDVVETTLKIGDKPHSAVVDIDGNVWVLTGGYTEYDANWNVVSETSGVLAKINTNTNTVEAEYLFPIGNHPEDLVINGAGDKLYYSDGSWSKAVYEFGINDTELSTTPIINRNFYGLGYDPTTNEIYGSDAVDFTQQGWVYRYATTGALVDSFQVGIIPGGFAFPQINSSIFNVISASISVYPNPSEGIFFISSSEKIKLVTIRNILGSVVNSFTPLNFSDVIDLSKEKTGFYIAEIHTNSGIITKKIVIE